jgi:hypothetical protein
LCTLFCCSGEIHTTQNLPLTTLLSGAVITTLRPQTFFILPPQTLSLLNTDLPLGVSSCCLSVNLVASRDLTEVQPYRICPLVIGFTLSRVLKVNPCCSLCQHFFFFPPSCCVA